MIYIAKIYGGKEETNSSLDRSQNIRAKMVKLSDEMGYNAENFLTKVV